MRETLRNLLTGVFVVALLAAVVGVGYIVIMPVSLTEPYTEFYLLNTAMEAGNYPSNLTVGESGRVIAGIENHEHHSQTYTIVLVSQSTVLDTRTVTLADDQRWRGTFTVSFNSPGERKVTFKLYTGHSQDPTPPPYRELHLFITVTEDSTE